MVIISQYVGNYKRGGGLLNESELQQVVARLAPDHFRETQFVGREVIWGRRVVDIVLGTTNSRDADLDDLPPALGRVNTLQLYALALIASRRRVSTDLLARRFHLDCEQCQMATKRLLASGLVEEYGKTCLGLGDWQAFLPSSLTAIEVKLNDWREAAAQARAYLDVADQAYVAMPQEAVMKAKESVFAPTGIGVLSVGGAGTMTTARPSRAHIRPRQALAPWIERMAALRDLANGRRKWCRVGK